MTEAFEHGHTDLGGLAPDTAKTSQENVRTADADIHEPEVPEPEDFDASEQEPTGFREVELDNGDIEMQPYWDDQEEDEDTGSKLA